jgi:hypothetical protein
MGTRQDIADAASTVIGVNVTPYYRQSMKPGDGCVSLLRMEQDDTRFGYMERWAVTIALSQDLKSAEEWIDTHADELIEALSTQMVVTAMMPMTLVMDSGNVPGLVVEGSRGH